MYVLRALIHISSTGKDIKDIITDSMLGLLMGMTMTILIGDYGITRAMNSQIFLNRKREYGNSIEKCDPFIQYCDDFCNEKNEKKLEIEKTKFLRKYGIRYVDYINCNLNYDTLRDSQKEALEKVENIRIFQLDTDYLLSECDEEKIKNSKKITISSYKTKTYFGQIFTKIVTAVVFGLYTVETLKVINLSNVIWYAFQMAIWIAMAFITFSKNYDYIINDYCQNVIIVKTNYLHEFYNLMQEDPNRYKKKNETNDNIILLPPLRKDDSNKL